MAYSNPIPKINDEPLPKDEFDVDYSPIENVYFAFIDVLGFKKNI